MYKFNVSAPGRVFLNGNPVKYKQLCIAASLNMRTTLAFSSMVPLGRPYFIQLDFSGIMLNMKIPVAALYEHFSRRNFDRMPADPELLAAVREFVDSLTDYTGTYEPDNRGHRLSLEAFFFLFLRIAHERSITISSSFIVKVSTKLAIGEGLGSSASFATCLAACFYRWALLQKGIAVYVFNDEHLVDISKYVRACDAIIYNSSTTIDAMVSVYGSVQVFEKERLMNLFCDMPHMKALLIFSNVRQKTTVEQTEHMERTMQLYPFVETMQSGIDKIVERSTQVFEDIERRLARLNETYNVTCDSDEDLFYLLPKTASLKISILVQINQGLLCALGMSHPNLDIICAIAQKFSLKGKLASNGGGGYAIILLLPSTTDEAINRLQNELKSHNFPVNMTSLNCSGVRIE